MVRSSREVKNPLFIHEIWGASLKPPWPKPSLGKKKPGEGKECTQGYKYVLQYMSLTKVKLEMGQIPCIGYFFPR